MLPDDSLTPEPKAGSERLTRIGVILGTPRYMSPEQALGRRCEPASDIYSAGVVLYELLTGRVPVDADTSSDVAEQLLTGKLRPVNELGSGIVVPKEIERITLKALATRPEDRFGSAEEFRAALRGAIAETGSEPRRRLAPALFAGLAVLLALALGGALGLSWQTTPISSPNRGAFPSAEVAKLRSDSLRLFGELPPSLDLDAPLLVGETRVQLGRALYHDPRLSKKGKISCNTCHPLDRFGADGESTSLGHDGRRGTRNSPTVFNAGLQVAQFWDGRAASLEEQATGPILDELEMGMTEESTLETLREIKGYGPLFEAAFPDEGLTLEAVGRALGAYERRLLTPSRFDDFLAGDSRALRDDELEGLQTFLSVGCTTCHVGPGVGGTMFQSLGLVHDYPSADLGRFEVTKFPSDKGVFKVPTLRNVGETAPICTTGLSPTWLRSLNSWPGTSWASA